MALGSMHFFLFCLVCLVIKVDGFIDCSIHLPIDGPTKPDLRPNYIAKRVHDGLVFSMDLMDFLSQPQTAQLRQLFLLYQTNTKNRVLVQKLQLKATKLTDQVHRYAPAVQKDYFVKQFCHTMQEFAGLVSRYRGANKLHRFFLSSEFKEALEEHQSKLTDLSFELHAELFGYVGMLLESVAQTMQREGELQVCDAEISDSRVSVFLKGQKACYRQDKYLDQKERKTCDLDMFSVFKMEVAPCDER